MIPMLIQTAKLVGILPSLLLGIVETESNFNGRMGDNGKAYGIGQVHCPTARFIRKKFKNEEYFKNLKSFKCSDLKNDRTNAIYTAYYLKRQDTRYKEHKNYEYCVKSSYNAGSCIPKNQEYVDKVRRLQKKYKKYD